MSLSILRLPDVTAKTGLSRSTIYERIKPESKWYDPTFPKPVHLGARAVGFVGKDVDAWIEARIEEASRFAA